MNTDNFAEAEKGIENIGRIQRDLTGICTSQTVMKKGEELREKLGTIVDEHSKNDDFKNIESYFVKPPKDLLKRLTAVAKHDPKYGQAYTALLGKLRQDFSGEIEKLRSVPRKERAGKLRALNYALCFVPDELQAPFKAHIDEINQNATDEDKMHERDLGVCLKNTDENEHNITKIGQLAERFQQPDMDDYAQKLHEEILKRLQVYRTNLQASLDTEDMQSALAIIEKIIKYKDAIVSYVPGVKGIYEATRNSTIKSLENCCKILAEISKIEKSEIVEKAFSSTILCVDFSNTLPTKDEEFIPRTVIQNCTKSCKVMGDYLQDNSDKYQTALDTLTVDELCRTMAISKKWDILLNEVRNCRTKNNATKALFPDVRLVTKHDDMVEKVVKEVDDLKDKLEVELISEETTRFEKHREELFSTLKESLTTLKQIDDKLKGILPKPVNVEESEEKIKKKAEAICEQLLEVSSKPQLTTVECDRFRKYYNHLVAFNKHMKFSSINTQSTLDESKSKVFQRVASLRNEFVKAGESFDKATDVLVEMKSLAENLSMFDTEINVEVDGALKAYKEKSGPAILSKLTMKLEKTDVGVRIMSEHALLKGEDWRKRSANMQRQDDPDYILEKIEGDDLDKIVLKSRYQTFKNKYDEIISSNLGSSDEKSTLDALVSNTQCFVDTATRNLKYTLLDIPFKDKIPELLANIFAIWTLQNTEYYNSMRGIESRDAYLLRPHVAQIIAIFRILGIGYESSEANKNLINNLAQIGTGEGKSVVMAITACVFALCGVDVNCSCYSEVLSRRDKESFAPIFTALGIDERIEYGTFNKLCENLLNEQCNVREKVCDMILKNKNALDVVDKQKSNRRKVLLIDEVDVFLSEKYYGGTYTPSVYLKHPSIKALLDTIWENRTIRTLNGIKAMPAYKTCASQFSNWTDLLDEAVKDMIASLQSFESSTYIVQNDRIVYVEGESIAENVVRGYDTIWAYYHENRKGKISSSSLESNVGIIINCGTFSYAEMPHDFVYIAGVTGTLKTLAKPEKEILVNVYDIRKNTYMPSVFGECNRSKGWENYVRVTNEKDYFMKMRGEIDRIRNAKRAILVFFESEEKLMTFYNSSELSSLKAEVQIVTEKISPKDTELYIKRATTMEKVTLLTRTFGRGIDFVCSNQQLIANGGICVLQTFFSEELSEEVQIMGRGARQGDIGSYCMILLDKDLEWVLGSSWAEELQKIESRTLYGNLNQARNAHYESKCAAKGLGIEQCKQEHNASKNFMKSLNEGNIKAVKEFLKKQNQGANLVTGSSRTVLLMDATGSMSSLLSAAKETVCTMFEGATKVLNELKLPSDAFQMQFVVYRDYDCKEDGILQSSPWESKPINLRSFMTPIAATGGGDYEEAIEIGLWYAVQQSEQSDGISQVILIGDAPAKERPAITRDRNGSGGEMYWSKTKYKTPTYYMDELQKLKAKSIPVHTLYLAAGAAKNFQDIADKTSGLCKKLDIHSPQGAAFLTDFVTENILKKTADDQADAAVALYRKKYAKSFTG
ncbi:unnamed protein product [Rotaria sp. Silwood1]|nr:unnamed protein product [Rotaria sp. Silwood1]